MNDVGELPKVIGCAVLPRRCGEDKFFRRPGSRRDDEEPVDCAGGERSKPRPEQLLEVLRHGQELPGWPDSLLQDGPQSQARRMRFLQRSGASGAGWGA